jgi:hypothetical protein
MPAREPDARERLSCTRSIRIAVPLTPPPSRLTPKTQRLIPKLDPIRAPTVLGGTAHALGCTCAAAVCVRACARARLCVDAALSGVCARCAMAFINACVGVSVSVSVSFGVFVRARACVRVFACVGRRCHVEMPYGQRAVGWPTCAHIRDRRCRRHLRHRRRRRRRLHLLQRRVGEHRRRCGPDSRRGWPGVRGGYSTQGVLRVLGCSRGLSRGTRGVHGGCLEVL